MTFTNLAGSDIAVGNATGYGKAFLVPVAGAVVDFTGVQLESSQAQLDTLKLAGYLTWVKSDNPNMSDDVEILAGSPARTLLTAAVVVAAKSATAVHAAIRGDTAITAVTTGLTSPAVARNVSSTTGADWDGGNTVVVGTDQFDMAQTETIVNVATTTVYGVRAFKTVTSVSHTVLGVAAGGTNTYSVGTGDKIGVPFNVVSSTAMLYRAMVLETPTIDVTNDCYTPATAPGGESFILVCSINP
jgi:hypothetical protein